MIARASRRSSMRHRFSNSISYLPSTVVLLLIIVSLGYRPNPVALAIVTKIIQDVTKKSETADWTKAAKGDALVAGDHVRTGEKSLAVLKFMDKSLVRVREQSEVKITGEVTGGSLTKTIQLEKGGFGFDIRKQQNERFQFTSPTSVASIRGTSGTWVSILANDTLVNIAGLIDLLNRIANQSINVPVGYIAFSGSDGSLSSRQATPEELAAARNLVSGGAPDELNLEMRDSKGNKKDFKIRFKQ